jgi:hypothetical protein
MVRIFQTRQREYERYGIFFKYPWEMEIFHEGIKNESNSDNQGTVSLSSEYELISIVWRSDIQDVKILFDLFIEQWEKWGNITIVWRFNSSVSGHNFSTDYENYRNHIPVETFNVFIKEFKCH